MAIKNLFVFTFGLAFVCNSLVNVQSADARRAFFAGPNGAAGAYGYHNQYGGRMGGAAIGRNMGAGIRGGNWAGPNGGSLQTGGGFGYKRGVGAFRKSGWQGQTANGASGSGYTRNMYNAQTGQGTRSSAEQIQTVAGKDYGYTGTTQYAKGQGGVTQLDTQNKGDYSIDWQKGQKPVVTPD